MENIFEKIKKEWEDKKEVNWEYDNQSLVPEEQLQYIILKQRDDNLGKFLESLKEYYEDIDITDLKELLFFYNDLKEVNFIGTDLFANAMFIKNTVPYLYRSIGKDTNKEEDLIQCKDHVSKIFTECLCQIQTGGKGNLFSYSKCFGKVLYKYITLQSEGEKTRIEIRQNAHVNSIIYYEKEMSIQRYARKCADANNSKEKLPYFSIDMSNARGGDVKHLKEWLETFLGKQDWHWHKDIVDPIGDAEVVCNFTNGNDNSGILCKKVVRITITQEQFCILLYKYFKKYYEESSFFGFDEFITNTLETLKNYEDGEKLCKYYTYIMSHDNDDVVNEILGYICWESEEKYMKKRKTNKHSKRDVYL